MWALVAENVLLSGRQTLFLILLGENPEPEAEYRLHGGLTENPEAEGQNRCLSEWGGQWLLAAREGRLWRR